MAGWIDIYKIENNSDYVHNYKNNFESIFQGNISDTGTYYKELKNAAKIVIIAIIDELIADWDKFRKAFIDQGVKLGLTKNKDPEAFMVDYNIHFKKMTSGTLTGDMLDLKKATYQHKTKLRKEKNPAKAAQIVQENWEKLIRFLIAALNFYEEQNRIWVTQVTGEKEKDYQSRIGKKMPINRILKEVKKALAPLGITEESDISSILDILYKIQNGTLNLSTATQEEIFTSTYTTGFAEASGKLIEYTVDVEMKADQILNKFVDNQTDIRMPLGVILKDLLVGDTVVMTVEVDNQPVSLLASMKLTDKVSVERDYNTVTDILQTRKLEFTNKSIQIDENLYNKISWIRKNLISLNVLSYEKSSNGEISTKSNDIDLTEFYAFEEDIALWNLIPRILDGIYEYQEENIIKPQFNGNRVHTALFFTKGQFVWMVDILLGLRNLLASGNIESGIIKAHPTYFGPPIKESDLQELYKEKRKALQNLGKKRTKIDYITIAKELKSLGRIDENFRSWRPIKSLRTTVKYSQFIK